MRHGSVTPIKSSRRLLSLVQPETGDLPVVENTNGQPSIRETEARSSRAIGGNGTRCCLRFLVLLEEISQVPSSRSSSHRISPTSRKRLPINKRSWKIGPKGFPNSSHALQKRRISSLVSIRSRAAGEGGRCTPTHGLCSTIRWPC